jgi:hypothetical protein
MKIITIGDIHGHDEWKSVDHRSYDRIIFLGDYLDSFVMTDNEILENFKAIIEFRLTWPDKVVLLLGNHETSYISSRFRCTGFRPAMAVILGKLLFRHFDIFRIAWQHENYLWTHAGIHQDYYDRKISGKVLETDDTLSGTLQRLYEDGYTPIFEVGYERGGRFGNRGGPLWVDKSRLRENPLRGYHQIVGHNPVKTIEQYRPYHDDPNTTVTFCDCIERGDGSFYEVEVNT